jgi:hypothetical protein
MQPTTSIYWGRPLLSCLDALFDAAGNDIIRLKRVTIPATAQLQADPLPAAQSLITDYRLLITDYCG